MKHCPITGLPITEKEQWIFQSPKGDYTKKFTLIGQDILHAEKCSGNNLVLERPSLDKLSIIIDEERLSGNPLYILIDCANIVGFSYSFKKSLTGLIYNWNPDFRVVVLYNIDPLIKLHAEMFKSIAPRGLPFILAGTYAEAMAAIMDVKSGSSGESLPKEPEVALDLRLKEEFFSALARMAWLGMFDQQLNMPPENHQAYPFFKAIEAIQSDFKAIEQERETHAELALRECRERLTQKTAALSAQTELNKKYSNLFQEEKSSLMSKLSTRESESTRTSPANADKSSTLKVLCELIADLDVDPRTKQQITSCCLNLVDTGRKEKLLTTELTEADAAFISRLQKAHPNLNQRELRICLLIKRDHNSQEIAGLTGLSVRGVESIRYRMHQKVGIDKHRSLKTYLSGLSTEKP